MMTAINVILNRRYAYINDQAQHKLNSCVDKTLVLNDKIYKNIIPSDTHEQ